MKIQTKKIYQCQALKILFFILSLFVLNIESAIALKSRGAGANFSIVAPKIGVDLNRDGKIVLGKSTEDYPSDITYTETGVDDLEILPFRFWLNNDLDVVNNGSFFNEGKIDWIRTSCSGLNDVYDVINEYQQTCEQWDEDPIKANSSNTSSTKIFRIESYRDLEDFSPLKIKIDTQIQGDEYFYELRAEGISINLFKGFWRDEGENKAHAYIYDSNKTAEQVDKANLKRNILLKSGEEAYKLTSYDIKTYFDGDGVGRFIFEGVKRTGDCEQMADACYIEIAYKKKGVDAPLKKQRVYMDLRNVNAYYQQITAGSAQPSGDVGFFPARFIDTSIVQVRGKKVDIYKGIFDQSEIDKDLVLQIHGWRMLDAEKTGFSNTSFKRLYWSGYKGQFTALSWPTGWHTKPANKYGALQIPYLIGHEQNYNNSEAVARLNAPKLVEWLNMHQHGENSHNAHINLHVIAHSMGNVLVSEALKSLADNVVASYTASQAAESAGAYDSNASNVNHELLLLASCVTDIGTLRGPEYAWRCYNLSNSLIESSTVFDMPPDMWRYDWIKRNMEGNPIGVNGEVVQAGGNYTIEHGATSDMYMKPNDFGNHYYKAIGTKTRILNFYNTQDAALTGWEFNQLLKPDFTTNLDVEFEWDYTNTFHEQYRIYEQGYQDCLNINIDNPLRVSICNNDTVVQNLKPDETLRYQSIFRRNGDVVPYNEQTKIEILSHVIPARTEPLGQTLVVQNQNNSATVEVEINQNMAGFTNSNQDHSAPFHGYYSEISSKSNTQQRAVYWNLVLDSSIDLREEDLTGLSNSIGIQ